LNAAALLPTSHEVPGTVIKVPQIRCSTVYFSPTSSMARNKKIYVADGTNWVMAAWPIAKRRVPVEW
jgi:hypothetical protein